MINMEEKIKKIIEEEINPMLATDGGFCEFVEFSAIGGSLPAEATPQALQAGASGGKDGVLKVKLQGACATCPYSAMTLSALVEKTIKEKMPEVKSVEAV